MRPVIFALLAFALLANGCVISETEKGAGPGDQKKAPSADPAPSGAATPPAR